MNPIDFTPLEIDYLSKDYASFRQLILDHLKMRVPGWAETSAADLGNVLVEVLAYAADYLSYYQDAVATEAYLGTARRRRSIKRHARLLDYRMHEGCNARAWVQVQVNEPLQLPKHTQLLTRAPHMENVPLLPAGSPAYYDAVSQGVTVFETTHTSSLYPLHNQIALYAEEGHETSLPVASTSAVLVGDLPDLQPGSILILQEVLNTGTGLPLGADPTHRYAVRLTDLTHSTKNDQPVVTIHWADDDALPANLPVSMYINGEYTPDISAFFGNILLADHGQTVMHESLPVVQPGVRYRPGLINKGLTFTDESHADPASMPSAASGLTQDVRQALPAVSLFELIHTIQLGKSSEMRAAFAQPGAAQPVARWLSSSGIRLADTSEVRPVGDSSLEIRDRIRHKDWVAVQEDDQVKLRSYKKWTVRPDLLSSGPLSTDYIVDVEEDGGAFLRFGFGGHGRLPQPGDSFQVSYRIGTGTSGNIRADTIAHVVSNDTRITGVRNPLPAEGGTDREAVDDVRLYAPNAFQTQERCVTAEDYNSITTRYPEVLNAVTQIRWIGSWYTAFVYAQRRSGQTMDTQFCTQVARFLTPFQLGGYDLQIRPPYFVPLAIKLAVTLKKGYDGHQVEAQLRQVFSSGLLPDGRQGFFYPDRHTFNQAVYLSQVIGAAMGVTGIAYVEPIRFCRLDQPEPAAVADLISIGPLEIARLDGDPARPENGSIEFDILGRL